MNNVSNVPCAVSDEISLFDIWKKLVRYKKLFWGVFLMVFSIGATTVLIIPPKYKLSAIVETAAVINSDEKNIAEDVDSSILKIKKVFYPKALRLLNNKLSIKDGEVTVEKSGDNLVILSINVAAKDFNRYEELLNKIIEYFFDDTKEFVGERIGILEKNRINLNKELEEAKKNLQGISLRKVKNSSDIENQGLLAYLSEKVIMQLIEEIKKVQLQIDGSHGAKMVDEIFVSNKQVGPSRVVLMFLSMLASLFFAFFGVLLIDSCAHAGKRN